MTDREKAIVMAHTGVCMLTGNKFEIFHKYVEDIMDRPIMTHEIGFLADVIKEKSKADFISLCEEGQMEQRKLIIMAAECAVKNIMIERGSVSCLVGECKIT